MERKYEQHYRFEWEENPLFSPWLCKSSDDNAFCKACNTKFLPRIASIKDHSNSLKHNKNMIGFSSGSLSDFPISRTAQSLCLSSEEYSKNLFNGLSILQQNGEFVDMTLAADGHFIKVHQVVMALASTYFKEIISSIESSNHPVIFLNKMSHSTVSLLLEYIYSGEVTVPMESIKDFLEAAKELGIKGLDQLETSYSTIMPQSQPQPPQPQNTAEFFRQEDTRSDTNETDPIEISYEDENKQELHDMATPSIQESNNEFMTHMEIEKLDPPSESNGQSKQSVVNQNTVIQYTVSNQGNMQIILNRYVYFLKYKNKDGSRHWRCTQYSRCPAVVITKNNLVVRRVGAHTHPFHDKKILKKVKKGAVFSAMQVAEKEGNVMKIKRKKL